jgi:hypothetical protein
MTKHTAAVAADPVMSANRPTSDLQEINEAEGETGKPGDPAKNGRRRKVQ